MDRAQVKKHRHRRTTAWLIEKLTRLKTAVDDKGDGTLQIPEGLEWSRSESEGKRELWQSPRATSGQMPFLKELNFEI